MLWGISPHCPTLKCLSILMRGIGLDPSTLLSLDSSIVAWLKGRKTVKLGLPHSPLHLEALCQWQGRPKLLQEAP